MAKKKPAEPHMVRSSDIKTAPVNAKALPRMPLANADVDVSRVWSRLKRPWKSGMRGLLLVLGLLSLTGGVSAGSIAGYWYGEGYQPLWGENAQWLMHLSPNGGYAIEFRQYRHCQVVLDQRETGTWELGDEFRTVTTALNGQPTRYENDYRVGALTDTEFNITHIGTGQVYVERRVGARFVMPKPDCPTS